MSRERVVVPLPPAPPETRCIGELDVGAIVEYGRYLTGIGRCSFTGRVVPFVGGSLIYVPGITVDQLIDNMK